MNNNQQQFTFLDILNIMSFYLGIMNLNSNMNQNDKQDLQKQLEEKTSSLLKEIHGHLEEQDNKIDSILKQLEAMKGDK